MLDYSDSCTIDKSPHKRREIRTQKHKEGIKPHGDRNRDWSHAAINQGISGATRSCKKQGRIWGLP